MGWGGTGSRLGLSRGLSEPARPRDRPKISDTFSPKPHTDSAGGDTENIFFLFLPPHPPHLPPSLAPSSPSRPRSSLPCRLPLPSSLLGALGLGGGGAEGGWEGGWARRPGRLGLCPSHLLNFQGDSREAGQGWQKRSASWAQDATLSLWPFPPSCHLGALIGFSGQAAVQSLVLPQGRQWELYPREPRGGGMGQEYARADASLGPCLAFSCKVPSTSPCLPQWSFGSRSKQIYLVGRGSKTSSLSSCLQ